MSESVKASVTLTRREALALYSFIYMTPPSNTGSSRQLHLILDRFDKMGFYPSDDGTQILANGVPPVIEMDFEKKELAAIKGVLHLKIQPGSMLQANIGVVRSVIRPMAKSLGIYKELEKDFEGSDHLESKIKLDSEYEDDEK